MEIFSLLVKIAKLCENKEEKDKGYRVIKGAMFRQSIHVIWWKKLNNFFEFTEWKMWFFKAEIGAKIEKKCENSNFKKIINTLIRQSCLFLKEISELIGTDKNNWINAVFS